MALFFKQGVMGFDRLHREMRRVLPTIANVWWDNADAADLLVTSVMEGTHGVGSLHYAGQAIDVRVPPGVTREGLVFVLRERLGDDFDVVDERNHIHIEYDPKGGA